MTELAVEQIHPERCWGALENHWNGSILDSIEAVVGCASSMTWKGRPPVVKLIETIYKKGVTLSKKAMRAVEEKIQRLRDVPLIVAPKTHRN